MMITILSLMGVITLIVYACLVVSSRYDKYD
jgi:hypothetical protein